MNRQLTGRIADLNFSPTEQNRKNLLKENVSDDIIYITGNTVIDALKTTVQMIISSRMSALTTLILTIRE